MMRLSDRVARSKTRRWPSSDRPPESADPLYGGDGVAARRARGRGSCRPPRQARCVVRQGEGVGARGGEGLHRGERGGVGDDDLVAGDPGDQVPREGGMRAGKGGARPVGADQLPGAAGDVEGDAAGGGARVGGVEGEHGGRARDGGATASTTAAASSAAATAPRRPRRTSGRSAMRAAPSARVASTATGTARPAPNARPTRTPVSGVPTARQAIASAQVANVSRKVVKPRPSRTPYSAAAAGTGRIRRHDSGTWRRTCGTIRRPAASPSAQHHAARRRPARRPARTASSPATRARRR